MPVLRELPGWLLTPAWHRHCALHAQRCLGAVPHCGSQFCSQIISLSCSSRRESEGRQQQPQEQYSHHDPVQTLALWHLPNPVCASTVGMLCHSTILALRPEASCLFGSACPLSTTFTSTSPAGLWLLALTVLASVRIQAFPSPGIA